jgi:hypothetical protein
MNRAQTRYARPDRIVPIRGQAHVATSGRRQGRRARAASTRVRESGELREKVAQTVIARQAGDESRRTRGRSPGSRRVVARYPRTMEVVSVPERLSGAVSLEGWRTVVNAVGQPRADGKRCKVGGLAPAAHQRENQQVQSNGPAPRSRRARTVDPLLTMRSFRQLVATHGNGYGLFRPLRRSVDLRLIATGCNHGAP